MTDKTREALAELVAIEDLKKSLAQANHHAARYPTDENYAVIDSLSTELARRRPLAWDAARSALSAPVEPVALTAEQIDATDVRDAEPVDLEEERCGTVSTAGELAALHEWAMTYPDYCNSLLCRRVLAALATPAQPPAAYPVKKVLEFAEYMAKGAEQFLAALNKLYAAEDHLEDGEHDEESRQAVDTAREAISDMWRSLECDIYEFRKRAAKVRLPAVEAEPDSAVPALMREPQLVRCGIYRMPNSQWVRYLGLSRRRGELGQALFLPVRDADRRSFCLPIETAEQLRLVYTPEQWALKSLVAQGV